MPLAAWGHTVLVYRPRHATLRFAVGTGGVFFSLVPSALLRCFAVGLGTGGLRVGELRTGWWQQRLPARWRRACKKQCSPGEKEGVGLP
jgi:hypothetical protein